MFVQSARFIESHRKTQTDRLAIHGQEKVAATVNLCRMNLAVHGLEGDIRQAITYYEDPFGACNAAGVEPSPATACHPLPVGEGRGEGHKIETHGRFDFVLANPPFNVDAGDKERLAAEAGPGRRYPFGLPRTENANYLGFNSSTPRCTRKAGPASSWPTPPPTPGRANKTSANN
jgi:type I restriction enzyme M protein